MSYPPRRPPPPPPQPTPAEVWIRAWVAATHAPGDKCHSYVAATRWADAALDDYQNRFPQPEQPAPP